MTFSTLQKVKLNAVFCYIACDVSITLAEQTSTIDGKTIRFRKISRDWNTPRGCKYTSVFQVRLDGKPIGLAIVTDKSSKFLPIVGSDISTADTLKESVTRWIEKQ